MLTTVIAGRVYDYSHAVGRNAAAGDGFSYPSAIALAAQGVMYVVSRGNETNYGSRVTKVYVGEPGEEKVLAEFCRYGANPGQALWPNSVAVDGQGRVYVSDDWLNRIAVFDPDGEFIEDWGVSGNGAGSASTARRDWPSTPMTGFTSWTAATTACRCTRPAAST